LQSCKKSRPTAKPASPSKNSDSGPERGGRTATGQSTGTGTLLPTPEPDLARVVEVLDRHGVNYLIVGGHAARAYGATRPTKDTDCLAKTEEENLARVAAALGLCEASERPNIPREYVLLPLR